VGQPLHLELTADEAIVLFDFLSRFASTDNLTIEDEAERRALWNLQCVLEKSLVEPWLAEYRELLEQARGRLRDSLE
jgi:hypothetical protein